MRVFGTIVMAMLLPAVSAGDEDGVSRLFGKWRGTSSCVARNTACRDETVVYHLARLPDKPGYVSINADKIVNGNAIHMGTLEFRYDQSMLVCEYAQGVWRLKVTGEKMEGTLTRQDGTEFRRVMLRKEP
jgi:hypothetical protein